jgi:hypothetical protein
MTQLHNLFKTTRLSIWLLMCVLILAATSVYAAGDQRPLAAVDILGSPDAAVNGKFAVGTTTPGNKALTVAGVIDFVGAGTVHNYFTQGPGNNMQIRSNVDEYNSVGNSSYAQWNMVMGASLDVFSIRRSPASSTYNEDALFWIEGDTGNVGISKVDTSNGATIPFTVQARLHVATDSGDGIWGITTATSGIVNGVYGKSESTEGFGVFGVASSSSGVVYGVVGANESNGGAGVWGYATSTTGSVNGVNGRTYSTSGRGVYGLATATTGQTYGVYGTSFSTAGYGVYGYAQASSGGNYGVYGRTLSTSGRAVYGWASASSGITYGVAGISYSPTGYGVYGRTSATSGMNYGVYGESNSTEGYGVYGYADSDSGYTIGVLGRSWSNAGVGVYGWGDATTGIPIGVMGVSEYSSGFDFYASGSGSDYGPFTGVHEARLADAFPLEVKAGLIVSVTGEAQMRRSADGELDFSSTLPTIVLTDRSEDSAVLGVLVAEISLPPNHWYVADEEERFASVNALGEGRVWVTNINGDINAGDAITSSEIPGYGQRQDDDVVHIFTVGKATETVDWASVTETVMFNGQQYKVYPIAVVYTSG